ncbi:MAG: hypothetical protein QN149_13415 [Armatimonadota bacterium]|nr:hypothetical protein [Armatimonadota bacterium]
MKTLAEICDSAVAFSYRSIDRLIVNAYIPTLQTPGAVARFLRDVCHKPILSPVVFKGLTDRFVAQVQRFAQSHQIPILRPTGRTKPGAVAQRVLRHAARANRWGVVAIVVHQESARVFAGYHAGGRTTNFRVQEDRRLVNHYYFYLRDRTYGDGFVRISSYPPFQTRIWLNAHGYLAAQLRRQGVACQTEDNCVVEVADPGALQRAAAQVTARLVEQIARRWLALVPDPLMPDKRAAGYPTRFSIYQAEFSDNVIFRQTQVLNRVYEQLLRDHLHLGRADMVKVIFGRQIRKKYAIGVRDADLAPRRVPGPHRIPCHYALPESASGGPGLSPRPLDLRADRDSLHEWRAARRRHPVRRASGDANPGGPGLCWAHVQGLRQQRVPRRAGRALRR